MNGGVTVAIRYALADEAALLTEIELDADQRYADSAHPEIAGGNHIPTEALARAASRRQVLVAEEDGTVVGWILLTMSGDELCIGQISVRRAAGGRGIGTKLLTTSIESARAGGRASIVLNTHTDVAWNQPWYERHGFEVVDPADWTPDMHVIADEQTADGMDWSTRVHMRLRL